MIRGVASREYEFRGKWDAFFRGKWHAFLRRSLLILPLTKIFLLLGIGEGVVSFVTNDAVKLNHTFVNILELFHVATDILASNLILQLFNLRKFNCSKALFGAVIIVHSVC